MEHDNNPQDLPPGVMPIDNNEKNEDNVKPIFEGPGGPSKVGKVKTIVNNSSFTLVPRSIVDPSYYEPTLEKKVQGILSLTDHSSADLLRVSLGHNWDFGQQSNSFSIANEPSEEIFANSWTPLRIFQKQPIFLESCGPAKKSSIVDQATEEKIVIGCSMPDNFDAFDSLNDSKRKWVKLIKLGVTSLNTGIECLPIINSSRQYLDHYHNGDNPFNPEDQQTKVVPAGSLVYNHKTYYNERIDSSDYEAMIASRTGLSNSLPSIYGLASIIRTFGLPKQDGTESLTYEQAVSKFLQYYLIDQQTLANAINTFSPTAHETITSSGLFNSNILFTDPFGVLFSLYGSMGTQKYDPLLLLIASAGTTTLAAELLSGLSRTNIVERIINSKLAAPLSAAGDVDSFFETYFNEYAYRVTQDENLNQPIDTNLKLTLLEKSFTNIIFDRKVENKVDHIVNFYKNFFPFYNEITFSSSGYSEIAALIENTGFDQFFLHHLAETASQFRANRYKNRTRRLDDSEIITPGGQIDVDVSLEAFESLFGTLPNQPSSFEGADIPTEVKLYDRSVVLPFIDFFSEELISNVENGNGDVDITRAPVENEKKVFDILRMLERFMESLISQNPYFVDFDSDTFDIRNFIAHLRDEQAEAGNNSDMSAFFKYMLAGNIMSTIMQKYEQEKRSWLDIMEGKPAYTENLFYRIEKTLINTVDIGGETDFSRPTQNIFIPSRSAQANNIIKYIDTQVKYHTAERYKYKVYVYRLVLGSKYYYRWFNNSDDSLNEEFDQFLENQGPYPRAGLPENIESLLLLEEDGTYFTGMGYSNPVIPNGMTNPGNTQVNNEFDNPFGDLFDFDIDPSSEEADPDSSYSTAEAVHYGDFTATLKAIVEPSIRLVEDLYFETPEMLIMDKPPVPPFVDLIPYRAVNNKIKILLDGLVDRFRAEPVIMLDSDQQQFDNAARSQFSYDGKIEFGSDDPISTFQIFRTEKHPETYSDFELYQTVDDKSYEEMLQPNKKYFYTFRAVDPHGHVSNPTAIYEVQLIDEAGAVKPKIRTVSFKTPDLTDDIKDFRKYIMIRPSLKQLYRSQDPQIDSIFSSGFDKKRKKYKLRLTSKMTGKKIDVNLSFEKKIKNGT